jgi:proteic killer suppression protein
MIKTFRHKGLAELWRTGRSAKIDDRMARRVIQRLEALDKATRPQDMHIPGFDFHPLKGRPQRYTVHVNGPWAVTFEFADGHAWRVDLEQYH